MEKPITILIAADHGLVAKAWQFILSLDPRINAVAGCNDIESVLLRATTLRPDIIMLDVNMKRLLEVNAVPFIERVSPGSRILGISMYTFPGVSDMLLEAGVSGYLTKSSSIKELFEAIVEVKAGNKYLCAALKRSGCQPEDKHIQKGLSLLSLREMDVVAGINQGFSLQELAEQFKVPYRAIKKHHEMILKKLEMDSASELIDYLAKSPAL